MDKERCKICGGTIFLDKENKKAYCEYCGTAVSLTPQMQDEIRGYEYEKKKKAEDDFATEQAKIQYERNEINFFNRSSLKILLIVLLVCVGVAALAEMGLKNPITCAVCLIQTILCVVALLCGSRVIRSKKKHITAILTVLVFILIIPFVLFNNLEADMKSAAKNADKNKEEILEWPDTGLAAMLPVPDFKYGRITHNGADYIDADIYFVSEDEYKTYREECIGLGFSDITDDDNDSIDAYNSNNYYLRLRYDEDNSELSVYIKAPESFDGFKWPKNNLVKLLPTPKADKSNVEADWSSYCCIHIADFSLEDVESYIDECIDAGFTENHFRSSGYYYASTKNGERLTIDYDERQKIMSININEK